MIDTTILFEILGVAVVCLILGGMIGYDIGADKTMEKVYKVLETHKKNSLENESLQDKESET
jgi:uncharacterized membrane protein YqgA involved in biofilm formation